MPFLETEAVGTIKPVGERKINQGYKWHYVHNVELKSITDLNFLVGNRFLRL
jgi:hypothetical protein